MHIGVCIHVNDDMKADLYRLYCRRNPIGQAVIVVLGLGLLAAAVPLLPGKGHFPLWERVYLGVMAVLLILSAFYLRQVWWRWHYWPRVQRDFPAIEPVCVQLSATGIRHGEQPEFAYSRYLGFSMDERAVLLFVSKSYPVPFHRSLFATDSDWQWFCNAVRQAFKHRTLLQRLNEPL